MTNSSCQRSFSSPASSSSSSLSSSPNQILAPPALSKVLIANRGEIACRVIRTCRRWGIPTVAVYSVADGPHALHAQMADEAYLIGPGPTPSESYLRQDELVQLAQQVGVQAIHPGYGFLSENAHFAQRIQQHGMIFVGPPTKAIQAMGSKAESKAIMDAAGVPTTPGFYETAIDKNDATTTPQNVEQLRQRAVEIGFPVLIKAVMGGGGKGMRLVWNESDFLDSLASCQREAAAAFGNDHVLLEKYLVRPRHVEVQIVADTHGNVVSLYERDCSLQRRHQKIIEEAPASDLTLELRQQLGEMGRRAAAAVGYVNAGTVEFLLDTQSLSSSSSSSMPSFYFCEMNTRLQVEHPITEAITGIDLVEWQLRVAAGEALPIPNSDDIPCRGHAFEARIYAEQPTRQFLPATGHVWHHSIPTQHQQQQADAASSASSAGDAKSHHPGSVRVDTSIQKGHNVSVYYDPMISKLIVHGDNRVQALQRLIHALRNYEIAGVPTNIDFLIQCAQHKTFQTAGAINTGFLEDFAQDLNLDHDQFLQRMAPPLGQAIGAYTAMLYLEQRRNSPQAQNAPSSSSSATLSSNHPWSSSQGSWRLGGLAGRARRLLKRSNINSEGGTTAIECISNPDGSFEFLIPTSSKSDGVTETSNDSEPQRFHVNGGFVNETGSEMQVQVNKSQTVRLNCVFREAKGQIIVNMWPKNLPFDYAWEVRLENPYSPEAAEAASLLLGGEVTAAMAGATVKAPMPGKISRINHAKGSVVAKGDVVLVMEAMKMEHAIKASMDGTIERLQYKVGDIVGHDDVLFEIGNSSSPKEDAASTSSTR
ncbi:hypothetical protein ACA910_014041 [Epithemia clementina (nom. ined.)]